MIYVPCDNKHFFQAMNNNELLITVESKSITTDGIDFEFVKYILDNLSKYQSMASEFLFISCKQSPYRFGFKELPPSLNIENIISELLSIHFYIDKQWGIIVQGRLLPIGVEIGILINFQEDKILSYENLDEGEYEIID
jgi:hypothetical protein